METHPDPANAKSDGPNAVPLHRMRELLTSLAALDRVVKQQPSLKMILPECLAVQFELSVFES
jgi:2-dehydro-3-deoxyphosphooctonate aldolase (KDO 8-P synthase)